MKEVLKETLKEAKEAVKKKASAKKATATKEAMKKDTASAKPADTAKVGSKDERTSPLVKRQSVKKPRGLTMSNLNLEVLLSPPGLILLVNQQSPEQAPPGLLQGQEILTRIVVDPQGPHHKTLRDHLLLLILLVVAIPVSPQE